LAPGQNYCFYVQAQNGCTPGDRSNVVCTKSTAFSSPVLGTTDNYNPLVVSIKESYGGEILGEATELAQTAEKGYSSDKLPSGNVVDVGHFISIPAIRVNQPIYLPQKIGNELTIGHREILFTALNDTKFYYGHNATDVFGSLYKIKLKDLIFVVKNDQKLTYQVTATNFVSKYNVSSVKTDNSDQIILMTCSYTQPDYRILVTASLVK